jgi:hypothetical protein
MKSEKLSTEIAALERKIKSAKNAVVKKVLEKKIETLRSELKKEEDGLSKLAKAKKKIREMSQKDFNEFIKMLSKKDGFAFLKSMTKDEIKRDIKREAKPVGWRFRGDNTKKPTRRDIREKNDVYYEGRRNRSDVSRAIKLAEGGGVDRFKDFELNKEGNFESIIDGKKYEIIYRDDVSQMYDLFEDGKIINSNKSVRDVMKFKNGGKMEWGGTAESSETGEFIGSENQSSMYANGGSLFDEPHRTEMSGMMAKGGGVDGNFYILLNDDSKKWYSQEDVTKIPNIYFASGFQDPNDEGVAFVHYDNALRPVYKANGQRADKMFQYAGMRGSEIKAKGGGVGNWAKEIEIVALSQSGTRGYEIYDTMTNRRAINTDGSYEFDDGEISEIIGEKNMDAFYDGHDKFKPKKKLNFDIYANGGGVGSNGGMMAKGGATSMFKYEIYAENTKTGEKSTVAHVKSYGDIPLMITGLKMGVKTSPIKYGFKEIK